MNQSVHVCALTALDTALMPLRIDMAYGRNVAEIVGEVLPRATEEMLARARVWLVTNRGKTLLPDMGKWRRITPRPGVRVIIRIVPGDNDILRSALTIAVAIGAAALGQVWAAPAISTFFGGGAVGTVLGSIGGALVTAGALFLGTAAINLLIPPAQAQAGGAIESEKPNFAISGWQNSANPGGVIASIFGRHRIAPVFVAPVYSEIVGDQQYVRALFGVGYGPLDLSDLRLKDTPLDKFDDIDVEVREGYAGDAPITLYPSQVIEDGLGVELRKDRLRDSAGTIIGIGPETPVSRFTASDATEACLIFNFPAGLISYVTSGETAGTAQSQSVSIRVRQRPAAGGDWSTVANLTFTNKKREGFYRSYRWTLPSRGRWEIELTRVTDEATESNVSDRSVWLALQSFRPEKPLNFDKPLALVAMRVRATYQLNSQLDTFNLIAQKVAPDWDNATQTWITRPTRNPASAYRLVLQGPENAYPEPDAGIDLAWLQDFHDFCRIKGLKYDRIHDFEASVWDVLGDICRAGRASPRHDGRKWAGVIDRPQELVIDHINERNSRDFQWSRSYFKPPHALRVSFLDETADYQTRERIVRWPGYVGDITITEQITLPGKTDPAEIWIETRRRQYEIIHRPDRFTAVQDGAVQVATRGDLVKASYSTLDKWLFAHRVTAVRDGYVTLDGFVEMEAGEAYAARFMVQVGEDDEAVFESALRDVITVEGETDSIGFAGSGVLPEVGTTVHFGLAGQESLDLVVAGTEAGEQMTSVVTMLAAAPIIDELTDAEVPPAWNGRAGGDADADITVPAVPRVTGIETHFTGGVADGLTVLLEPGAGSSALVASYSLRHRLAGDSVWTLVNDVPAGDGAANLLGYAAGDDVEFEVLATSRDGYSSPYSATITGTLDAPAPAPGIPPSGTLTGGMGAAFINYSTPAGPNFAEVRIYRNAVDNFETADLVATIPGLPLSSYAHVDGDGTKTSLIDNGGFASDADWIKGTGWTIAGGLADKAPGDATAIQQALPLVAGRTYRFAFEIADHVDGSVTPALLGGADVEGDAASGEDRFYGALVATADSDDFGIVADIDFEGSIDNVVVFEEGATSLPQGTFFYFITAANGDGAESAPLALGSAIII